MGHPRGAKFLLLFLDCFNTIFLGNDGKWALEVAITHNKGSKRGYFLAQFQFIGDLVGNGTHYTIFEL